MSQVLDRNLNIRISRQLLDQIHRAAKKSRDSDSSWIRRKLEQAVKRELGK